VVNAAQTSSKLDGGGSWTQDYNVGKLINQHFLRLVMWGHSLAQDRADINWDIIQVSHCEGLKQKNRSSQSWIGSYITNTLAWPNSEIQALFHIINTRPKLLTQVISFLFANSVMMISLSASEKYCGTTSFNWFCFIFKTGSISIKRPVGVAMCTNNVIAIKQSMTSQQW